MREEGGREKADIHQVPRGEEEEGVGAHMGGYKQKDGMYFHG